MSITEHFVALEDSRIECMQRHQLLDITTIASCAVICRAGTWVDVQEFGKAKRAWPETFLDLPNGISSHDTFDCVFAHVNPEQFQARFLRWVQAITMILPARQLATRGKTVRRSHDRAAGGDERMQNSGQMHPAVTALAFDQ